MNDTQRDVCRELFRLRQELSRRFDLPPRLQRLRAGRRKELRYLLDGDPCPCQPDGGPWPGCYRRKAARAWAGLFAHLDHYGPHPWEDQGAPEELHCALVAAAKLLQRYACEAEPWAPLWPLLEAFVDRWEAWELASHEGPGR